MDVRRDGNKGRIDCRSDARRQMRMAASASVGVLDRHDTMMIDVVGDIVVRSCV